MPTIWILNHYAGFPENVPATRTFELAKSLAGAGWDVTVISGSFNHYTFTDDLPPEAPRIAEQLRDGVRWVFVRGTPYQRNGFRRLKNMLDYARLASRWGRRNAPPDLIIGTTVHPFAAEAARRLSRRYRIPFVYEVTDLWPETLVDLGQVTRLSPLYRTFHRLEHLAFASADGVIGLLPGVAAYARETHGIEPRRFAYVPNGTLPRPLPLPLPQPAPHTVIYAGGFARAHGMSAIVEAAALLRDSGDDYTFNLYGDGPERIGLQARAQELGLDRVRFHGFVPKTELREIIMRSQVCLCTGDAMPVHRYGISTNKLFDYFDAARPIVFAVDSSNNPVAEAEAGITVPARDGVALAAAIRALGETSELELGAMGARGRKFLEEHHDFDRLAERLRGFLSDVIAAREGSVSAQ